LIVSQENLPAALEAFEGHEFTITTGSRYLGGFIGEREALDIWIQEKVVKWADAVEVLATVAVDYPQSAYTALQKSLQQEWQFLQRVVKDIGEAFTVVGKAISQSFLPALFGEDLDDDDYRRRLAALPVKHCGVALQDPTASAKPNYEASTLVNVHLLAALKGNEVFRSADHKAVSREVRSELKTRKKAKDDLELKSILSTLPCDLRRAVERGKATAMDSVMPSTRYRTSAQEYRDAFPAGDVLEISNLTVMVRLWPEE
jgi:hypothetical protein